MTTFTREPLAEFGRGYFEGGLFRMPVLANRPEPKSIGGKETTMQLNDRIMVLGHRGLIGSAIVRHLKERGFQNIIILPRAEVDLTNAAEVEWAFSVFVPDFVYLCAARVGGIAANAADPVGFFLDNIRIQNNVITAAAKYRTRKLLFLASSCCYPQDAPQPLRPASLLTGPIHPDTEPYALAKLTGIRLCQWYKSQGHNFISALPCNVYGPGDNYNPESSHCVPGLLRRLHDAMQRKDPQFVVWGDGTAQREVIYSDDCAEALVMLMESYSGNLPANCGSDDEMTIRDMARTIARVIGYTGDIVFDPSKPVGVQRKLMDNRTVRGFGWMPKTDFLMGVWKAYDAFLVDNRRQ